MARYNPFLMHNWLINSNTRSVSADTDPLSANGADIEIAAQLIGNTNWTEWSTFQGVIARVFSKLDEREARGRFEMTSTITPWIVRYEVQLLIINRIYRYKSFGIKNVFWELLLSENVCSAYPKFSTLYKNIAKEADWRRAWHCYRKLNLVKISPHAFAFCPNVSLS